MCELLNRIWARPRGEWTRVLRRELPALAEGMVEELRESIPGFAELIEDTGDEVVREAVEAALLAALGYDESAARGQQPGPDATADHAAAAAPGSGRPDAGPRRAAETGRARDRAAGQDRRSGRERDLPDHGQDRPGHERDRPDHEQSRPDHERDRPDHEQSRPDHGQGLPDHGQDRPDHGQDRPDHGQDRPGHDHDHDRHTGRVLDRDPGRVLDRDHERKHGRDRAPGLIPRQRPRIAPVTTLPTAAFGGSGPESARRELFTVLTGDMTMPDQALAELAAAAGWPLPAALRAIALATPGETQQLASVLDDGLVGMVGGQPCLLVPSPDPDARTALEAALRGRFAAVGHTVALRDTASSLRWALRLLTLTPARSAPDARAVFVDDHLSTLMLLQDEPLAHALAARWLRPLANLTPRQSERLEVTLLAWLEGGGAPEAAKALSVHPQTVRYRMRQLEKLFGPGLRDPRTRFELEMALRSRRLMAQVRRQHSRVGRRARAMTADFRPLGVGRMARVNGL